MYSEFTIDGGEREFFIGEDAQLKRGILKLNYPIKHGVIENWEEMEKIQDYIFTNELRVAPEEHNVMITEYSWNYKINREKKIAKIMFEKFAVHGLYIINPIALPLYMQANLLALLQIQEIEQLNSLQYLMDINFLLMIAMILEEEI